MGFLSLWMPKVDLLITLLWRDFGGALNMRVFIQRATALVKKARIGINEYINIYNKERLHSILDYPTPDEVYYKGANNKNYDAKKVWLEAV